jgi:hypothetical protein
MEFENAPLPSNTPVVLVGQVASGAATFVDVSQVKLPPGTPPLPVILKVG